MADTPRVMIIRRRRRRGIVCGVIYLAVCGLAYVAGVVGNTDSSGLSYWWLIIVLLPWTFVWVSVFSDPPAFAVIFSSMALNVSLIYWIARGVSRDPRRPRRPKRWSVETKGNSIEVVRQRRPPGR